jgi:uncharacterized protein
LGKIDQLKQIVSRYSKIAIAFSGGVDSTFLAKICKDTLSQNIILFTFASPVHPQFEVKEALSIARYLDLPLEVIASKEMENPLFYKNPPDRCYHCKKGLFTTVLSLAREKGCGAVFDGSIADDDDDYRPGKKALEELGVISPLKLAGFTKREIRDASRKLNLPTAGKPSNSCLATRIPYGEKITIEKLKRIEQAEEAIRDEGFTVFRVRSHGNTARLEFSAGEMELAWKMRKKIYDICRQSGFVFAALDLRGYKSGSMNEGLDRDR